MKYLIDKGYVILDRNWRCGRGEIDIVSLSKVSGEIIIVEVRSWREKGEICKGNFRKTFTTDLRINDEVMKERIGGCEDLNVMFSQENNPLSPAACISRTKVWRLQRLGFRWCMSHGQDPEKLAILLLVVTWYNSRRFRIMEVAVY